MPGIFGMSRMSTCELGLLKDSGVVWVVGSMLDGLDVLK